MNNFPVMASRMFTPSKIISCVKVNNKGHVEETETELEEIFYIAFSNFQGTETTVDGVINNLDTATICMQYNNVIKANDKIKLLDTNKVYKIINTPENWNMQNLFLLFKVQNINGGV